MPAQLLIASRSTYFEYITSVESRVLAMAFMSLLLRNILLDDLNYLFLIWNLFLAYVPLLIQQLTLKHARSGSKWWYAAIAAWLLFLPNAPYIVTDFIHPVQSIQKGYSFGVPLGILSVGSAAAVGLLWYFRSLRYFDKQLDQLGIGEHLRRGAIALVTLATGCGVWMGRTLRLNTWDVLTKPWEVISDSAHFIVTPMYAEWILVTALLLWGSWRAYECWSWVGGVVE
ncbi:MAG: DUF1361 domain-containing protein [Saprospiraceae bacterium]